MSTLDFKFNGGLLYFIYPKTCLKISYYVKKLVNYFLNFKQLKENTI